MTLLPPLQVPSLTTIRSDPFKDECQVLLLRDSASQVSCVSVSQAQNLALHCASNTKAVPVKAESADRKDAGSFPLTQQQQQLAKASFNQPSASSTLTVKTGNQAAMTVTPAASVAPSSSSSSPALPLSQLLLSPSAAPVILVPTSNVTTSSQGYPIGSVAPKANMNPQTLVVQPLQQANANIEKGPVPIQPKTAQGHRFPVQLSPRQPPPILPAPPSNNQTNVGGHNAPHIPVQLVGARQVSAGNPQAVALAQARSNTAQESPSGVAVSSAPSSAAMVRSGCPALIKLCVLKKVITAFSQCISFHILSDKALRWLSKEKI